MSRIDHDIEFQKSLLKLCGLEDVKNIQELVINCSVTHLPVMTLTKLLDGGEDVRVLETKTYDVILKEREDASV